MGATTALVASGAASSMTSSYTQSQALKAQGAYQEKMSEINTRMANFQADDAIRRGGKEATEYKKQARQVLGSQRAALAAQGINVDEGSAAQVQEDTAAMAEMNAMTIRSNAMLEAFGFRAQARASNFQGEMSAMTARSQAKSTLLTGGLQAANQGAQNYYTMSGTKGRK